MDWDRNEAFQKSKDLLTLSSLLVHFDPTLPLILACDVSSYGVGAVQAHRMPDGQERPLGFSSRTLSHAEQNYAQLEREGLACVFGVKKVHLDICLSLSRIINHCWHCWVNISQHQCNLLLELKDGHCYCTVMSARLLLEELKHMEMRIHLAGCNFYL